MTIRMSLSGKLYRGTAGSSAATEVTTVGDAGLNIDWNEATIKNRSTPFELTELATGKVEVTFKMDDDDADTHLSAINTAFETRAAIALKVLDKASGKGFDADFKIVSRKRSENIDEQIQYDFTAKPCPSTRAPAFV